MQHIANFSSMVADVSQETTNNAVQGQANINTAIDSMDKIHQANAQMVASTSQLEQYSSKIESVAHLMKGIASQTNLLALNAILKLLVPGNMEMDLLLSLPRFASLRGAWRIVPACD